MEEKKVFDWEAAKAKVAELGKMLEHQTTGSVEDVLRKRLARYQQKEKVQEEKQDMVVFSREGVQYALPIDSLSEIRLLRRVTKIPGISPVIQGVINVRGTLVAIHDLAAFTHHKECSVNQEMWGLIGFEDASHVAVLADEVQDIQSFSASEIRPVPLALESQKHCFLGVGENGMLFLRLEGLMENKQFYLA